MLLLGPTPHVHSQMAMVPRDKFLPTSAAEDRETLPGQTRFITRTVTTRTSRLVVWKLRDSSHKRCHNSSVSEQHFNRPTTCTFGDLHPVGCPIGQAIGAAGIIERPGCVASSQRRYPAAQLTPRLLERAVQQRSPRRWRR